MLGHSPTYLSTGQELRDCESPSCQLICDGWLSLAPRTNKAQGWEWKGQKEGERCESEYRKGRFSDMHRTGPEIHPEAGHNIKQDTDVFLVKYWRYVLSCVSPSCTNSCLSPWQCGFWNIEKYLCEKLLWNTPSGFLKINLGLWNWRGQRKVEKGR